MAQSHEKVSNCPSHNSSDPASFTFSGSQRRGVSKKGSESYSLRPSNRTSNRQSNHKKLSKNDSVQIRSLRSRSSQEGQVKSGTGSKNKNSNTSSSQPAISNEKHQVSKGSSTNPEQTRPSENRVAASSSVNFTFLDDQEQVERYKNKYKEYQWLKAQLKQLEQQNKDQEKRERKRTAFKITRERQAFKNAKKKLQSHAFEIDDAHRLIENFAGILASRKMDPSSIEFGLLCGIVRRVKETIKFGDKVALGKREKQYLDVASKQGLIEFFTGIRLTSDRELQGAVFGQNWCGEMSAWTAPPQVVNNFAAAPANAETGLTAAMLKQFNKDHPLKSPWQRE